MTGAGAGPSQDLRRDPPPGWVALPGLAEAHVHLDKTLFGGAWVPHGGGADLAARIRWEQDVLAAHPDPTAVRAERLLHRLSERGVCALRTHVDVTDHAGLGRLDEVAELARRWSDRMTIDVVAFPQAGILRQERVRHLLREALHRGATTVGGLDPQGLDGDRGKHLDVVFALAAEHGRPVDVHLHERGACGVETLLAIAGRTEADGLQHRVAVSHAFALADLHRDAPGDLPRVAEALAGAGVSVHTSLPPVRVLPPVPDLIERGVNVVVVSDNIRTRGRPTARATPWNGRRRAGACSGGTPTRAWRGRSRWSPAPRAGRSGSPRTRGRGARPGRLGRRGGRRAAPRPDRGAPRTGRRRVPARRRGAVAAAVTRVAYTRVVLDGAETTILVEDGVVAGIGAGIGTAAPAGVTVVDGDGLLVLPAAVDAHVHLDKAFQLDRAAAAGAFDGGGLAGASGRPPPCARS
ncbi:hypothetical protein BJF78_00745 [Pseudonocardia sp. CNS-139]|nr:hypothetical protein BJF78_00745 [Pseudonocardia sp. CNS-139]